MVLEVNKNPELVVGLHSELTEDELTGKIRLGLGGMLVDKQKLFNPVRLSTSLFLKCEVVQQCFFF